MIKNLSLTISVMTAVAFYWNRLDYHTKALMPWKLMSEKPRSADQSLLLDYFSGNMLTVLSGAIRHRHIPMVISTSGSLVIILVTVYSTGLFVLQLADVQKLTRVSVLSTFNDTQLNASVVDSSPVRTVSSILSGDLSIGYPPNTNMDYAVDAFQVETHLDGKSQRISQEA
jgi:hypothetical protein